MMSSNKTIMLLGAVLVIIISLIIFLNIDKTSISENNSSTRKENPRLHKPVILNKDDVLVSYRIDDVTFEKKQRPFLENALYLAKKYNITFDLAVIAKRFDNGADSQAYELYQDNSDVFEIVAHGLTHTNQLNSSVKSEFGGLPASIQEEI